MQKRQLGNLEGITLNNGVAMPALGFGVFQTPPDVTSAAVAEALRFGYRLIDTAAAYGNEREVGEGIRRSGLARDEVFIETKVWISDYGYDTTLHAFDKSVGKLGVEQLDLLILHQALPSAFAPSALTARSKNCSRMARCAPSGAAISCPNISTACWPRRLQCPR